MSEDTQLLTEIRDVLKELLVLSKSKRAGTSAPSIDLDGPHGNPEVRAKDPKDWTSESMKGRKFSECPPTYLLLLAERFDYFAGKEADPTKANYNRMDAARARGWAARIEAGYKPPAAAPTEMAKADEITW